MESYVHPTHELLNLRVVLGTPKIKIVSEVRVVLEMS